MLSYSTSYTVGNDSYKLRVMQSFAQSCGELEINILPKAIVGVYAVKNNENYLIRDKNNMICKLPEGIDKQSFVTKI